jgi:GntR family transcriptional regulator of vanillate catabolism
MPIKMPATRKVLRIPGDAAIETFAVASAGQGLNAAKPAAPAVKTRAQNVTERLREAILSGHFVPNERLQEVSLSEMLNVSRTPIRAALQRLASEGMLEYEPNCGYNVRRLDAEELIEIFDIRGALEGLAARFAAERGLSEAAQGVYRIALADGDRILGKGRLVKSDIDAFREVNVRIHDTIIQAGGNRMIDDMIRTCHNVPMSSDRNILWDNYRWIVRSHDDHHRIFDAILDGEGGRAEQLMREHVHTVKMHLKRQLEADGALPA